MADIYEWIINFIGINNGYNDFSTHMYNFWSGFGGNISVLALIGAIIGLYRHHLTILKKFNALNPLNLMQNNPLLHRDEDKDDAGKKTGKR